jgi:dipeptidyl aminopeptidase/acylaminoacyl peptidase
MVRPLLTYRAMTLLRTGLLAAGVALLLAAPVRADSAPSRLPLKAFFDNPRYASATISPDGKRIAFLAPAENNRLNIWICAAGAPLDTAKLITHETARGVFSFSWTRDGCWILYSQDSKGDENFHLFRVDPDKPDAPPFELTPGPGSRADVIDLPRETPGVAVVSWNKRDPHSFDAYRVDIATGTATMVAQNPGDVETWHTDAHGRVLAADALLKNTETEFRVRPDESAPFRTLATYQEDEQASVQAFGADGTFLYVTSARNSNVIRLVKLDLQTGAETVIDQDPAYDVSGPVISDLTHQLLGVSYNKERATYKPIDPAFGRDLVALAKIHDGDIQITSATADEREWIVSYNSPTDPGATYLYHRDTGAAHFIFRPRPWLKPETLVGMQPITITSRDGLPLHGYLTLPKGVQPHNLPAVEIVHGGPWVRASWGYNAEAQFLANRGYASIIINYRGSTGFGKAFMKAGDKEWGGKMTDDMVDASNWLIAQKIADPKRIAIYGGSYGGYATLAALAFRPGVYACGIDYVGVSNLLTFMNTMPAYWEDQRAILYKKVGNPITETAFLKSRSPVFYADKIIAPLFIAQGYHDPRVNHAEAEQIVAALQRNGKPVEYMVKMDEGHGFKNPENRLDFYARMEAFLDQYLAPQH